MAVPAHDSRDYAFAKHFNLPIVPLVEGCDVSEESFDAKEGIVCNSPKAGVTPYCELTLNGLTIKEAIAATKKYVKEHNLGRVKVNFRLRDAIFSRQTKASFRWNFLRLLSSCLQKVENLLWDMQPVGHGM